jgi:hypothetical protein
MQEVTKITEWGCEQFFDDVGELYWVHRLTLELDLQSLFGLQVYSCSYWLRPRSPLAFGLISEVSLLVSQDRRHHFVTPWLGGSESVGM